ncbi:MAG TPA: hypothetical protein VIJ47_15815 [Acidimicrobiales bacterium]
MAWLLIGVAVLVVVTIAVVTIGAVVGRLSVEAPISVFDEDEAVEWIADRLPFEVAAQLSHDDVRQLMLWHLAFLEERGVATETAFEAAPDAVVVAEDDGLAYVIGQAGEAGMEVDDVQILAVLEAELEYLEAIGAVGPRVADPTGEEALG